MPRPPPPSIDDAPQTQDIDRSSEFPPEMMQQAMQRLFVAYSQCVTRVAQTDDRMEQFRTNLRRDALELALNVKRTEQDVQHLYQSNAQIKKTVFDEVQERDWEMYRTEHLAFVSNMESQFAAWLEYPWHILCSALRSMACQHEHLCPFCRTAHRNSGGTHDAWAYFNGCLSHLSIAPMCIGSFMLEDTLKGRGRPMTPPVIKLLEGLSPKQEAREWLPAITIIYMAPGGHRQWPMSITALLDRLSWIVLQTRPLALVSFQEAVQRDPKWQPKYRSGPKVAIAPSIPYKFLDIGTRIEKNRGATGRKHLDPPPKHLLATWHPFGHPLQNHPKKMPLPRVSFWNRPLIRPIVLQRFGTPRLESHDASVFYPKKIFWAEGAETGLDSGNVA